MIVAYGILKLLGYILFEEQLKYSSKQTDKPYSQSCKFWQTPLVVPSNVIQC